MAKYVASSRNMFVWSIKRELGDAVTLTSNLCVIGKLSSTNRPNELILLLGFIQNP